MKPRTRGLAMLGGTTTLVLLGLVVAAADRGYAASSEPPVFATSITSGIFSLPANAASVDWAVINDGTQPMQVRVTVFKCPVGQPKTVVAPGPVTVTLNPNATTHNANSVGLNQPFTPGFYYEVVVESNSPSIHPSVQVWSNNANAVIPGTLIGHGDFVPL